MCAMGAKRVLLSLGERGSLYFDGDMVYRAQAMKIVATNTVGAGDALLAGFIGRFKAGPVKALASAVAWSSAAITSRGSGISQPAQLYPVELISEINPKEASLREEVLHH
jgi:fructose-1-phosphate kinase PfkB-like protein